MSTEPDLKMSDYITSVGITISDLRLLIEGAVYLYNEEVEQLYWLARKSDLSMAAQSLTAIGTALQHLQGLIRSLQKAHSEEIQRLRADDFVP